MSNITDNQISNIGKVLNDDTRPLKERFRALFTLRNLGGPASIACISQCFSDSSALLKHELAYCLGQMQDKSAISILIRVLDDAAQDPMVRHEAAEALGALGSHNDKQITDILAKYINDPVCEVAETCQLAMDRIKWLADDKQNHLINSAYNSIDPAPPAAQMQHIDDLTAMLFDENLGLFQRYRAMFALRNLDTKEAVEVLGSALRRDVGSALFRHEIAFVLGQMQNENSVKFLISALEDCDENEMVRHECAEALGAIATSDCLVILNKFLSDNKRVVKESCEVALDMCEYENSPEFQYANTLLHNISVN